MTQQALADEYRVSRSTVGSITRGGTWTWVTSEQPQPERDPQTRCPPRVAVLLRCAA